MNKIVDCSFLFVLVFILSAFLPATSTAFCFDLNAEMDDCARQYRIPRLSDKRYGFNFGFGSINDTEYMCRLS